MKTQNTVTEHSKQLRIKTSEKWKKEKIKSGAYAFTVLITDAKIVEKVKKIPNKTQFLLEAIKKIS